MPPAVTCDGQRFEHVQTFKHDFFAATGLYRGPAGLAVLKLGRQSDFLTIPMRWMARLLTRREVGFYRALAGTPGVPALIGTVCGDSGFLHEFVPGRPLARDAQVSDRFFDELLALLRRLHERHFAYVDLNKRENILLGDDGRPYLIDFQIALHLPPEGWRRLAPIRWLLARFQHGDYYHALKHKRRLRPDLLTPAERAAAERPDFWIGLHRRVARPLTNLRRRVLKRLKRSEESTVPGASAK
jgi:serine/threonine protein kinase